MSITTFETALGSKITGKSNSAALVVGTIITLGIAYLTYKNWDKIKAVFVKKPTEKK